MSLHVLYDLTLEEALDVLWIVTVVPSKSYFLSAIVREAPADLGNWFAERGQKLHVSAFDHAFVDLQYLTVETSFDHQIATELATAWNAKWYVDKSGRQ